MNILFVCTGNTCRSPMAEALFNKKNDTHKAKSAGIYANEGVKISAYAEQVLMEKGIATNHRSQGISEELLEWSDIVVVMTKSHQLQLVAHYPAFQEKVHLLKEVANNDKYTESALNTGGDIIDPFGQELSAYRETLSDLEKYVARLIQIIDTGDNDYGEETSV